MLLLFSGVFAKLGDIGNAGSSKAQSAHVRDQLRPRRGGAHAGLPIPDKAVAAFRGRLGNLQRKGLFGAENMPGRGAALVYTPDMFHRLVFCCELFEFGIFSPATVLALVQLCGRAGFLRSSRKLNTLADAMIPDRTTSSCTWAE